MPLDEKELTTALRMLDDAGFALEIDLGRGRHSARRSVVDPTSGNEVVVRVLLDTENYALAVWDELPEGPSPRVDARGSWRDTRPVPLAQRAVRTAAEVENG